MRELPPEKCSNLFEGNIYYLLYLVINSVIPLYHIMLMELVILYFKCLCNYIYIFPVGYFTALRAHALIVLSNALQSSTRSCHHAVFNVYSSLHGSHFISRRYGYTGALSNSLFLMLINGFFFFS